MKKLVLLCVMACFMALTYSHKRPARQTSKFKNKYVSIEFDTTYLDCDQNLGTMILLNDTFYVFSERILRVPEFKDLTEKFYTFSKTGTKLSETDVSATFTSYYYLCTQNDSLIAIRGGRPETFWCFDKSELSWKPTPEVQFSLFEDGDYDVTSSNSGEWGGTIFFKDKRSGKTYEGRSTCPVHVCKQNGKYYVSNYLGHMRGHTSLYEIEDPRNMALYTGERPKEDRLIDQRECTSTKGMKKMMDILGDFGPPQYDSVLKRSVRTSRRIELFSSFVRKKQLLHLYAVDSDLFICKFETGDSVISNVDHKGIKNIYQFKTRVGNDPWVKFSKANYHQLHLSTASKDTHIIMEITPSTIFVHYIISKPRK